MKTFIIAIAMPCLLLTSCSNFEVKSTRGEDMPCYSTWNEYPENS